ncbi:MAG: F0F1 ATP synthase subunit B [Fervidobacterium sp.]|nr:F0F1 ATP synthase subunit B [Fervidobacterium sp.]
MDFFEINLTAVMQLMSFGFLLWMLNKLLYKPFFSMMEKRREKIENELSEAEKIRKQADEMRKQAEEELKSARTKADQIISSANSEADKIIQQAKLKAQKEAEKILENAQLEIERQKQEVLSQIQTIATELAINLAMKVLKGTLDEKAKREYLTKVIKEYEK